MRAARACLDWAWSTPGAAELGWRLTLAVLPAWFRVSSMDECCLHVERASSALGAAAVAPSAAHMRLLAARAALLMNEQGAGAAMRSAWEQVLELARAHGDVEHELRALWGLWVERRNGNAHRRALGYAQEFRAIQLARARGRAGTLSALAFDDAISARCFRAQILLFSGLSARALREAEENVREALALEHAPTLAYALALGACPIALLTRRLERAVACSSKARLTAASPFGGR